jgi:hypothetical protein
MAVSFADYGPHNPIRVYTVTALDLASVAANTTAEQDLTVTGVATTDVLVGVNKPTCSAGLGIAGARIKAADTIAVTFVNATAAPIDVAAETWIFTTIKG